MDDEPSLASAPLKYALGESAAVTRARVVAAVGVASTLAPLLLVLVLLRKMGYGFGTLPMLLAALFLVAAVTRGVLAYVRLVRYLRAFHVALEDDELTVIVPRETVIIPRSAVAGITEIEGRFGGLRLALTESAGPDAPERVDIPRGGESFGDLRSALGAWHAVTRAKRRSPGVRFVIGVAVVAGIFFIPFFVDDFVSRSRAGALGLVVGLWLVMRFLTRR